MSTFDRHRFDETLEAYLDGELSPAEARRLEAFAATDPEAREELQVAQLVQHRMQALPTLVCPPDVTSAVLDYARRDARRSVVERIRNALSSSWTTIIRPSLAVGVLAAVVVFGTVTTRPTPDPQQTVQVTEDIDQATEDVDQATEDIAQATEDIAQATEDVDQATEDVDQATEDVEKALDEAKWVLAYISDIGLQAANSIRDDVLEERVVVPVNRALDAAFEDEPHVQ